jgi:hypothetical protein
MKEDSRIDGPWEFGEKPVRRNNKTDWEEVKTMAKAGNLDALPSQIFCTHYMAMRAIAKDHMVIQPRTAPKRCLWYYGKPGSGKTRSALEEFPGAYRKLQNKWWDSYQ